MDKGRREPNGGGAGAVGDVVELWEKKVIVTAAMWRREERSREARERGEEGAMLS